MFLITLSSIALSSAFLMVFGYITAATVTDPTPEGVMVTLQKLSGSWAPLILLLIGLTSTPVNAINDTSGAYSLISAGFKISRPLAAVFSAVLGYIVCLLASSAFIEFFENFLSFFAHWMAPWAAVVLVHWYTTARSNRQTRPGITAGGVVFLTISALSIILFSANTLYTGILSGYFGGLDVGPYISFPVAGLVYWLWQGRGSAKIP